MVSQSHKLFHDGMACESVIVRAQAVAKINLSLDVLERRADGYHNIDSIMQAISLADGVTIKVAPLLCNCVPAAEKAVAFELKKIVAGGNEVTGNTKPCRINLTSNAAVPVDDKNTALRAAKIWCEKTAASGLDLRIELDKQIPLGAGLGGGSTDAASVLRSLNLLASMGIIKVTPLSEQELLQTAALIGADVPFCLIGGTARCRGIGEQIEVLDTLPAWPLLLALPEARVSTACAYRQLDQLPQPWQRPDTAQVIQAIEARDLPRLGRNAHNVFANLRTDLHHRLRRLEQTLQSTGAAMVQMTGSGPVIFAVYEDESQRDLALQELVNSAYTTTKFLAAHFTGLPSPPDIRCFPVADHEF
ncbi:MAG: 4-(cytidine 5'-diphospho)-2-C-methyl-D-erythritol kinase [Clostridiaceae bacterium]|jgi:4-diphosphocytidyl-2-C-methyl-D-erythritol kinase|nr:4-(cytidine 5'-diphospho)-2-C-methyl-D-erythritol kinase [Clostridiaceae bacterium]